MARLMIGLCVGWIVYFLLQMAYMTQHISLTLQYLSLRSLYTYTFKKFKPFPGFNYRWVPMMHFFFPRRRKKENMSRKIRKECYTPLGSFPLCIFFFPQPPIHLFHISLNLLQMNFRWRNLPDEKLIEVLTTIQFNKALTTNWLVSASRVYFLLFIVLWSPILNIN